MRFSQWLAKAGVWNVTWSNMHEHSLTFSSFHTFSVTREPLKNAKDGERLTGLKSRALWHRQRDEDPQTVTATVFLTVVNTIFQPSPQTSTATLPLSTPVPAQRSTATAAPFASTTLSDPAETRSSFEVAATSTASLSSASPVRSREPTEVSSTAAIEPPSASSTLTPLTSNTSPSPLASFTPTSPFILPTSIPSTRSELSLGSTNRTSDGLAGDSKSNSVRGPNRLLVPIIVISIIFALALVIFCLSYLYPQIRDSRARREAKAGSIFVDYSAAARTFQPLPSGQIDYQRSLSRKRVQRVQLVDRVDSPAEMKQAGSQTLSGQLWLPQTTAGEGLTRPI